MPRYLYLGASANEYDGYSFNSDLILISQIVYIITLYFVL